MAALTGAPQQYKQSSRKGKRAWRKNVDVSAIEAGLENVREEIIKGLVGYTNAIPICSYLIVYKQWHYRREALRRAFHSRYRRVPADPKIVQQGLQTAKSRSNTGSTFHSSSR